MALLDHFVGYGGKVTNGVANVIETRGSGNFAGLCQRHTENLNTEGAEGHGGIYPPCSSLEKNESAELRSAGQARAPVPTWTLLESILMSFAGPGARQFANSSCLPPA